MAALKNTYITLKLGNGGGSIDPSVLEGYATSGDMQSAFTLISETQHVAAAGLNQLEGRIDELSAATPSVDLSGYYTSAQTEDAISAATSGKADAANVTANTTMKFPLWNEQGVITGTTGNNLTTTGFYLNGTRRTLIKELMSGDLGDAYAPTTPGSAGQILVSTGKGAPIWSAMPAADVTKAYVDSADTALQDQIDTMDEVVSAALVDLKDKIDEISGATPSTEEIELPIAAAVNDLKSNIEARLDQQYYKKKEVNDIAARKVEAGQVDAQIKGYVDPAIEGVNDNIENKELATSAALNDLNAATVKSSVVKNIWSGTQSEYDAIAEKDPATLYIIKD